MERGLVMLLHASVIGLLLYLFMIFVLKQNSFIAENRSLLIAAVVLIYMILFGHRLPGSVNRHV